tara:strand:- start:33 stop:170 length:138 start_codon:yes stop_codon:yes gene_type:complete
VKVKIELDNHDTAETIDLIHRLVTALERLVESLEDTPEPAGKEDV